jgi:hypothetical protein
MMDLEAYFSPPEKNLLRKIPKPSPNVSRIRQELYNDPWYYKLLILWYLMTITIAGDLLYSFPAMNGEINFTFAQGLQATILQYVVWAVIDLAILWVSTLVFLDEDLQRVWKAWRLARFMSKKPASVIGWTFIVLVLLGASNIFNIIYEITVIFNLYI